MQDKKFIVNQLCEHINKLQQNNSYLVECIRLLKEQQNHLALLLNQNSWNQLQFVIYNNQCQLKVKTKDKKNQFITPYKQKNNHAQHLSTPYQSPIRQQSGIRKMKIRGNTSREYSQQNKTIFTEFQNLDDATSRVNFIDNEARIEEIIKQIKCSTPSHCCQNMKYLLKSRTIGESTLSCFATAERRQQSQLRSFAYQQQIPTSRLQQENLMLAIQNTKLRKRIEQLQQNYTHF